MDSTEFQYFLNNVLAVLVIYKSDLNNSDSFTSLSACLGIYSSKLDILIYDNSPLPILNPKQIDFPNWHINYIHDETNPGVSKAYNTGYNIARQMDKQWLLLLDQDTKFKPDTLLKYYQAVNTNRKLFLFAPILTSDMGEIYSPCKYVFRRGFPLKNIQPGLHNNKNISLLNSGLLISIDIFEKVGGYNEKLKLDFSDFEFIDRYRKISDRFFIISTECIHELSSNKQDIHSSIINFTRYCKELKVYLMADFDSFCLFCITFIRACKLSFRFRNINFILVLFMTLLFNSTSTKLDKII